LHEKDTKHVHVLEGHMHDTNTSPTTNCATTIEEWNKTTTTISANILQSVTIRVLTLDKVTLC